MSKEKIESIKKDARFLNAYSCLVSSKARTRYLDLKETNKILKSLVQEKREGGEKLTRVGALLLFTPDPVTSAIAIPVLFAAQTMRIRSKKKSDLQRIIEAAQNGFTLLLSLSEFS